MTRPGPSLTTTTGKDESLEAMRGLAAMVVVFWHLLLAFDPERSGALAQFPHALSWIGCPWFGLVNGPAAVGFFFVLSGYVLTKRSLQAGDSASLARGAVKRWPRLAGTVGLTCLISWALFPLGLYRNQQAGALTHSFWLSHFGVGRLGPTLVPDVWDALWQGVYFTFITGAATYNSSLWTMRVEFAGSFVAFGLALALLPLRPGRARTALLVTACVACFGIDPWLVSFPLGVALACAAGRPRRAALPLWSLPLLAAAAYAASCYSGNSAVGRWCLDQLGFVMPEPLVFGVGGTLGLALVVFNPAGRRLLSGSPARLLGRLSFPIYLLHLPVLMSAGCYAFLQAGGTNFGIAAGIVTTFLVTLLVAWPMAWFDVWWARRVDGVVRREAKQAVLY